MLGERRYEQETRGLQSSKRPLGFFIQIQACRAYLALLARAAQIMDQNRRLALYQQAEGILLEEAVLVPLA